MPEYPMLRHYLELVTELPWNKVFVNGRSFIILHRSQARRESTSSRHARTSTPTTTLLTL